MFAAFRLTCDPSALPVRSAHVYLYTAKLSRDEVRALFRHYELLDQLWSGVFEQEIAGLNSDAVAR